MRAGNKKQAKKSSLMCHCLILPHGPRAAVLLALCPACLPSGCELGSLRQPAALPSWAGRLAASTGLARYGPRASAP